MTVAYMNPKNITHITVHCAATPEGRDVKADTISKWDTDKFGQVSYHYVIELDGKVVQTLRHDQRGAHTGGRNTGNIGVCYIGGVAKDAKTPKDTRTAAQKDAIRKLVAKLKTEYPKVIVVGHRDWPNVAKACPSFDVKTAL